MNRRKGKGKKNFELGKVHNFGKRGLGKEFKREQKGEKKRNKRMVLVLWEGLK